jgi:hypothetical protein
VEPEAEKRNVENLGMPLNKRLQPAALSRRFLRQFSALGVSNWLDCKSRAVAESPSVGRRTCQVHVSFLTRSPIVITICSPE